MLLQFLFQEKQIEVQCLAGDVVKFYMVPATYSSDGLYVATWRYDEIEPFPACLGAETILLAHVHVGEQNGQPTLGGYLHQEVTAYATV